MTYVINIQILKRNLVYKLKFFIYKLNFIYKSKMSNLKSFNKTLLDNSLNDLPVIKLPLTKTLIYKSFSPVKLDIVKNSREIVDVKINKSETYKIDKVKNIITFEDGKFFYLDSLNTLNSRTGKSIDKNDTVLLANTYLNLDIPSKNKKEVFINKIKEKLGLY
jgi:hypothetical protein